MKKKNVVKRETREKKTHERTPVRIQKQETKKPVAVSESVIREEVKKQHIKKTRKIIVETKPIEPQVIENDIDIENNTNNENNEQNL